jgi:hypothetical protein
LLDLLLHLSKDEFRLVESSPLVAGFGSSAKLAIDAGVSAGLCGDIVYAQTPSQAS